MKEDPYSSIRRETPKPNRVIISKKYKIEEEELEEEIEQGLLEWYQGRETNQ